MVIKSDARMKVISTILCSFQHTAFANLLLSPLRRSEPGWCGRRRRRCLLQAVHVESIHAVHGVESRPVKLQSINFLGNRYHCGTLVEVSRDSRSAGKVSLRCHRVLNQWSREKVPGKYLCDATESWTSGVEKKRSFPSARCSQSVTWLRGSTVSRHGRSNGPWSPPPCSILWCIHQ